MKPKICQLFPETRYTALGDIIIEKIALSRQKRRAVVYLEELPPQEFCDQIKSLVKDQYMLMQVDIAVLEKDTRDAQNTMVVTKRPTTDPTTRDAEFTDKPRIKAMPGDVIYGRAIRDSITPIHEIQESAQFVTTRGQVFGIESKDITSKKNNKTYHIFTIDITDFEDSISVQLFITKTEDDEVYKRVSSQLVKGAYILVKGKAEYSQYQNEVMLSANSISITDSFVQKRIDEAEEKRVELHLHTNMSANDGMNNIKDIIKRAISWGHKSIAITDHGVVQSYPDAMKESDFNEKIKILYGIEGYLFDDTKPEIYGLAPDATTDEIRAAYMEDAKKKRANRVGGTYHIVIFAKNQAGIKSIYQMVSASSLNYIHNNIPRIPRSLLMEHRDNLILGSACEAGEVFRGILAKKSDEELLELASFYDYLEIQPLGNNAYLMRDNERYPEIRTEEDLMRLNEKVIELADKLGKPTCATCDVHFLDPVGADYRKIIMTFKGFRDADQQAPLYYRTTEEMLDEFKYLGKERAYEVVVTNTNKIADMIEPSRPIPPDKCPPEIEGANEDIENDSYTKAKEIYGEELPTIVKDRLEKELNSIITNGFAVMYKIAQELVRKSLSDGYLVGSRGSVGSSFVAFLSDITEVNSLPPHYVCPKCKHSEFVKLEYDISGCDLPDKVCPMCGTQYKKDGHDIPFETFLGFNGDKEPDIDLNFSGDYQPTIHKYTETYFGTGFVFRAGTIGTIAEKTAYGYVLNYEEKKGVQLREAERKRLAAGCVDVKRTSGQHPGGIIVVPLSNDIHNFCPVQHPADDPNTDIITTHFDYHKIDQNLLKLDELGHDDPTVIRMLQDLTGIDPQQIPLDDKETLSLFTSTKALNLQRPIDSTVGTFGVPEFGTDFTRQMLVDTQPTTFSELVRIAGLSHGTDVWLNNAQDLVRTGTCTLTQAICTRDDIMLYLINKGLDPSDSFKIMEAVRKGAVARGKVKDKWDVWQASMREHNVPEWYIESCEKIQYMFPKAHAVAYVTMAFRIAYCKVHYPEAFYISYFSVRADDFDASTMARGENIAREYMKELRDKKANNTISPKEKAKMPIMDVVIEMYARGLTFAKPDLYKSDALNFLHTDHGILPPLNALPGLGDNAARSIVEARQSAPFKTKEDLRIRSGINKTSMEILEQSGCLTDLPDSDQVTLFDI